MAKPALPLQLLPAEEAIGEAAAQQATRFIVIEGGKGAAVNEALAVSSRTALEEAVVVTAGRTLLIGLTRFVCALIAFYPSSTATGSEDQPSWSQNPDPKKEPLPVPNQTPEIVQNCPVDKPDCPPHQWVVKKAGESLDKATKRLQDQIDYLEKKKSPEKIRYKESLQFEKKAMELNNKKRPIESVSTIYKCVNPGCKAVQEVDILFEDGQVAESKSASLKTVRDDEYRKQSERLKDLQKFLNCQNGKTFKPMLKSDANHKDANDVEQEYQKRGFEIESLNTSYGG